MTSSNRRQAAKHKPNTDTLSSARHIYPHRFLTPSTHAFYFYLPRMRLCIISPTSFPNVLVTIVFPNRSACSLLPSVCVAQLQQLTTDDLDLPGTAVCTCSTAPRALRT
jgi:hypothetical protein